MSENEDKYHDTVLDLEAKLKKNVDLILKLGNSLQGMFMLGPKPLSVYDQQLKHGLGYPNPYTLKQAISQCPKLYLASSLGNSEISLNVRDTEDTFDDASKNFVPQKELSAEQKYFPSSFIPSDKNSNATPSIPASMPSIFIRQSQYAIELLKKHGLDECVSMITPMATERLDVDLQGTPTDQTTYHRIPGFEQIAYSRTQKELSLTLDDFRTFFHLPQANDNNHNSFVPPPSFSDMVPFYKQQLGFTMELKTSSSFKILVRATVANIMLYIFQVLDNTCYRMGSTTVANKQIDVMLCQSENVIDDSSPPRNDEPQITGTRLEPQSDKESPEVERTKDEERREKGKVVEESRSTPLPTPIKSPRTHAYLVSSDTEKLQFLSMKTFDTLADHLQEVMVESLPIMMKSKNLQVPQTTCRPSVIRPRDQDDPYDDAYPEGENSAKRKEILVSTYPRKATPLVQSYQRDPEALALSLINQDLLYLKKGSSGPEKIVLSLHKFLAIIFNDDDIEECTSKWENKCVKKSNPYAQYVIKTYWELGHEHKFVTEIVARRANECIVSITEPDYKNLNKNDIEDMYLLIMNGKVPDYAETGLLWSLSVFIRSSVIWERVHDFQLGIESYQQKVNLTAPTMSFPGVEKHKMFSIIYEPVHGIIYKNSKKKKRAMRHSEIHKFYVATLNRVLEGLKSYNNDVKYGYVQRELTNDEVGYLKLFEERNELDEATYSKMRRWEIYVNRRPLGPRRERPE
ncbi:hypothetical protein Tco_0802447 [Tanacetum coccineum]|uniref:Uncharacterized protein n=1 Tax=Tanacetum coccineum TaxID=301880 RepID=A0ABQ4ZYT9_9ASTR